MYGKLTEVCKGSRRVSRTKKKGRINMLLDRFLPRIEFDSYKDFKENYHNP